VKVTLQEKIAELESRISALEKKTHVPLIQSSIESKAFCSRWNNLWREFDLMMRDIFRYE